MKVIGQVGIFFAICLAGEFLSALLPLPVPGSILALAILFALLLCGALKPAHIGEKSDFLLQNMAFFFLPAGVGILEQASLLWENLIPLLVVCAVSTVATFGASAGTVKLMLYLQRRARHE